MTRAACKIAIIVLLAGLPVAAAGDRLVFHAETLDGKAIATRGADTAVNPASVVKVGTSLWALDRLGPDYRFRTVFFRRGRIENGALEGDLGLRAGGDPDFQVENVFLVAAELNRQGVFQVSGDLVVTGDLWCGWEHGAERRIEDPAMRGPVAGATVRAALDPKRWTTSMLASWDSMARRRGLDIAHPPRVRVDGGVRYERIGEAREGAAIVFHSSAPLPVVLKRFNVYSNNDIVRIADDLGGVAELERYLAGRVGNSVSLSTASGELVNRMSPRQMVGLIRSLVVDLRNRGLEPGDVLPVLGCDAGPTRRMFPAFVRSSRVGAVTVKTGSLTTTDGGVAVLAGIARTWDKGEIVFAVAAPAAGGDLHRWRRAEQSWLLDLIERSGGAVPTTCGSELPFSDTQAVVEPPMPIHCGFGEDGEP